MYQWLIPCLRDNRQVDGEKRDCIFYSNDLFYIGFHTKLLSVYRFTSSHFFRLNLKLCMLIE